MRRVIEAESIIYGRERRGERERERAGGGRFIPGRNAVRRRATSLFTVSNKKPRLQSHFRHEVIILKLTNPAPHTPIPAPPLPCPASKLLCEKKKIYISGEHPSATLCSENKVFFVSFFFFLVSFGFNISCVLSSA